MPALAGAFRPLPLRFLLLVLLAGLLALGGCSDEEGSDGGTEPPPPPPGPDLSLRFSVYLLEGDIASDPTTTLLWKGDPSGPDADSPQRTAVPRLPGAEPFRIAWELKDPPDSLRGFQYRASQEEVRRLPLDEDEESYWGDVDHFDFFNSTPPESLGARCAAGGDCPEIRIWNAQDTHSFWAWASTESGEETDPDDAHLLFEIVNEPPTTSLVQDGTYPYYRVGAGPAMPLADGDSIPAGARVVFRLAGEDPDPVLLKRAVLPEVRFQGRYEAVNLEQPTEVFSTFYSPALAADTLSFAVTAAHYTFTGRAVDRLRDVDRSPVQLSFYAGFAPRILGSSPQAGDAVILRRPDQAPWPENTVDYQVLGGEDAVRYWTGVRFDSFPVEGSTQIQGRLFRIPLRLDGEGDPREPATAGYGAVRAWSYEWVSDNDPANTIREGGGYDQLGLWRDGDVIDLYRLEGEDAIEIFIPDAFWSNPAIYEEGTCIDDAPLFGCAIGAYLATQLGEVTLRARGRTTSVAQEHVYYNQLIEDPSQLLRRTVADWGPVSALYEAAFPVRIGLDDDDDGTRDRYWPAP
jgi:hypothetical protein